jgi:hypothetical protein
MATETEVQKAMQDAREAADKRTVLGPTVKTAGPKSKNAGKTVTDYLTIPMPADVQAQCDSALTVLRKAVAGADKWIRSQYKARPGCKLVVNHNSFALAGLAKFELQYSVVEDANASSDVVRVNFDSLGTSWDVK